MQFLLTGGSGFIGSNLAKLLVSRGHAVRALVRRTSIRSELEKAGASFAVGDLNSGDGLPEALEGVDAVLHLAGVTKARTEEEYFLCNGEGTRRLAEAIARMPDPARLVHCSSLSAAGPTTVGRPLREEDEPRPISVYGRSKLAGELAVRQYADRVPSVIVRPPLVYGPADKEFLPSLLPMARFGLYLKSGTGPKRYSLIHVDDLCEGLIAAAMKGKTLQSGVPGQGLYFVTDGRDEYSWEEVCDELGRAWGRERSVVVPLPDVVGYAAGLGSELVSRVRGTVPILNRDKAAEMRAEAWTCASDRARQELDYAPKVPLAEGLKMTLEWYRQEGWV
ncbi:MAG: NAD-dependent epimerase/dehydratase family protein [Myxococcaceae bacterium]